MTTEELAAKLCHDIERHWSEKDKQRFRQALREDLENTKTEQQEYDRDPEAWNRAYAAKYVRQLNSTLKLTDEDRSMLHGMAFLRIDLVAVAEVVDHRNRAAGRVLGSNI